MKKIIQIIMLVLLLSIQSASARIVGGIYVGDSIDEIRISQVSLPELAVGDEGVIEITLENIADTSLTNIQATFRSDIVDVRDKSRNYPIISIGSPSYYISGIAQNSSAKAYFRIGVQSNIDPGTYLAGVDITYTYTDTTSTITKSFGIPVLGMSRPQIELADVVIEPQYPKPGQVFNLSFTLKNTKSTEAKDVLASLESVTSKQSSMLGSTASAPIIVPLGVSTKVIGNLKPDEAVEVKYPLAIAETAQSGPYVIRVNLNYVNYYNNKDQSLFREIGVYVKGNPNIDVTIPETTSHSPYTTAKIKINNPGTGEARNVKISVLENDYFSPGKIAFVSGVLGRDDVIDTEIDFYSKIKEAGAYPLMLKLTYQSPMGENSEEVLNTLIYIKKSSPTGGLILLLIIFGVPAYLISRKYRLGGKVKGWIKRDKPASEVTRKDVITSPPPDIEKTVWNEIKTLAFRD